MTSPGEVTQLLARVTAGEGDAAEALLPLVYEELRRLARSKMAREREGHTLQATALAHEAFLNLLGQERVQWQSRAHFLSVAALAMRRFLINHAKAKLADKRGGAAPVVAFDDEALGKAATASELVALDDALTGLARHNERQSTVVAYKFFGGLSYEDIAEVMGISVPTVRRDWRFARAWLLAELGA
jgi:RNA polymerase sigma factor (TIGR02999 family)